MSSEGEAAGSTSIGYDLSGATSACDETTLLLDGRGIQPESGLITSIPAWKVTKIRMKGKREPYLSVANRRVYSTDDGSRERSSRRIQWSRDLLGIKLKQLHINGIAAVAVLIRVGSGEVPTKTL